MATGRSRQAYRLFLRLLPATFRERHQAGLVEGFAELLRDARERRGLRGVGTAWLAGIWDLLRHLPRLHRRRRRRTGRGVPAGSPHGSSDGSRTLGALRALGELGHDLRLAVRALRRSPGFTAVAVTTLALGIGLVAAAFSIVNGAVVRALPYTEPDRLVQLWGTHEGEPTVWGNASLPDLDDWRAATTSFEGLAGFTDTRRAFTGGEEPAFVEVGRVTEEFFALLDVEAVLGRVLGPQDFRDGAVASVVVGHAAWRNRFGSDPGVLARTIRLGEESFTIVGVLPPKEHALPSNDTEFWIPQERGMHRGSRSLSVIGRLADGVTLEAAGADLGSITATLAAEYPESNAGRSVRLVPLEEIVVGDEADVLLMLFGAAGFVLVIAVANVVNLFYSRALDRRRELAIRTAIGASRSRLLRHVGAEALVLALCAGVVGLVAAHGAVEAFVVLAPADVPRLGEIGVDGATMVFVTLLLLAVTSVVGVAAALRPPSSLRASAGAARPGRAWRGWLIAAEVALSVVLVVGAGLLLRSFSRLQGVEKGFVADGVLSWRLTLPGSRYERPPDVFGFHAELFERIEALPSVASAGGVTVLPFARGNLSDTVAVDGSPREDLSVEFRSVSGDYFATMGMELLAGRPLGPQDTRDARPVALVNRTLARRAWPGESPIGRTITIFGRTWDVVGVVSDVRHFGLDVPPGPELYVSYGQQPRRYLTYVVRTTGDPTDLAPTVRDLVRAADPELPVEDMATMRERVRRSAAAPRFRTGLLGTLATAALVLAAVGVYGMAACSVSRRTREIGIRRALGARASTVMGGVVGRGMLFVGIGAAVGTALAAALTGTLRGLLFEVEPLDPPTFVVAVTIICGAAVLGCLRPALRAAAVDPLTAIADETGSR